MNTNWLTDPPRWQDLSAERWLPVPGYEQLYHVSDAGHVRSLTRHTRAGIRSGRPLKTNISPAGYPQLGLCRDGQQRTYPVHQLVAMAFLGPRPDDLEVRHLDGNPTNNLIDNLKYGTASENARDSLRHGTNVNSNKTHCPSGHQYAGENLAQRARGGRLCRTCRRESNAAIARRRKAARAAK